MKRLQKPSRRKGPMGEIQNELNDVLTTSDAGRMMMVQEANFLWQKKQLRKYLRNKGVFKYREMKAFIHENGRDELWIPTKRLPAYWRAICRTGRL
jgi:hypothetical protein